MVRIAYLGISDPVATCKALAPYRRHLIALQSRCKPQHEQYKALEHALRGLDDTIEALTGNRQLLWAKDANRFAELPKGP